MLQLTRLIRYWLSKVDRVAAAIYQCSWKYEGSTNPYGRNLLNLNKRRKLPVMTVPGIVPYESSHYKICPEDDGLRFYSLNSVIMVISI